MSILAVVAASTFVVANWPTAIVYVALIIGAAYVVGRIF